MDDAAIGRVYLPAAWLAEAGIGAADVGRSEHRAAVFAVVRRLLAEAERYYASARQGLAQLGFRAAWAVATARGVYRDIGRQVLARGPSAWNHRVVVTHPRKVYRGLEAGAVAVGATTLGRLRKAVPREGLWTKPEPDHPA
jgi:phytoene synthase